MLLLICSFLTAFVTTLLVVRSSASHAHLSGDTDKDQPQKFHGRVVPRIGGIGILVGVLAACLLVVTRSMPGGPMLLGLVACGLIAFTAGLIEDFTKKVSPRQRLLATVAAAAMAFWLVDAVIDLTGIPGMDGLALVAGIPFALTLLTVAGVSNSVNIIDGFNGLASMCVAIMLAAVAYVAFQVNDIAVMNCALVGLGAVLGFFVWNYPLGLIFLGDGGAYFLGFWVAELGILLVHRNAEVSPVFPLLLCAYPIFETLFTMYRRRIIRGRPVGLPDATHLHSLIYRRLMRWAVGKQDAANLLRRNSMTSPYLWVLCSLSVLPAVLWWGDGAVLSAILIMFCLSYLALYRAIVHFRTPRFLLRKADHWAAPIQEH
ncbi:glycosyltransferase [uncultured Sphaerotilus sp.]|uniref:MraY family glycosyltransferase n=1 Tax=uncultured Sphaerotilus sp. TaxID=474984 RepID=UPI0030CA46B2